MGFFLIEFKRVWYYLPNVLFGILQIGIRLTLPYSVFYILASTGKIAQSEVNYLLWTVLIGQMLYITTAQIDRLIRNEIRSRAMSVKLSDPVNYSAAKLVGSFGSFVTTFGFYGLIFFPIFVIFFPININLILLLSFSLSGFLLVSCLKILVGLSSFILEENEGLSWILSKLFLIFGNNAIPVSLMPDWMLTIAKFTPFYLGMGVPVEADPFH